MDGIKNLSSPSRVNDWARTACGDVTQERGAGIAKTTSSIFSPVVEVLRSCTSGSVVWSAAMRL